MRVVRARCRRNAQTPPLLPLPPPGERLPGISRYPSCFQIPLPTTSLERGIGNNGSRLEHGWNVRGRFVGSFKVKLVAYFLLLSLLPIVAAFWGFTSVAGQSETRRVDARLQSGLRAVLTSYQQRLDAAQQEANTLARTPVFQAQLRRRDLPALVHLLRDEPSVSVAGVDGLTVGRPPGFSATRQVAVVTREGLVGTITVAVPFDAALVDVLRARSGLSSADALVILHDARIVASSPTVAGTLTSSVGQTRTARIGRASCRERVEI